MDRIIDYRMLSSLSDDMKKVLVDTASKAHWAASYILMLFSKSMLNRL